MIKSNPKVILITGCSSGFGNNTAKLLAENGDIVYTAVRKYGDLQKLKSIENLHPVLLDVTWQQSRIDKTITQIIGKERRIDVLINNAGFGLLGLSGNLTVDEIKIQFETNFFGQIKVTNSVLPFMRKRKNGLIIMINSISGIVSTAFYGAYSASKFALDAITATLRFEEAANGINVVGIYPGSHQTDFWKNIKWGGNFPQTNNKIKSIISKISWHRENPIKVALKIKEIIDLKHTRKEYIVGKSAHLIYYAYKLIPYDVFDWLGKKIAGRIIKN